MSEILKDITDNICWTQEKAGNSDSFFLRGYYRGKKIVYVSNSRGGITVSSEWKKVVKVVTKIDSHKILFSE